MERFITTFYKAFYQDNKQISGSEKKWAVGLMLISIVGSVLLLYSFV